MLCCYYHYYYYYYYPIKGRFTSKGNIFCKMIQPVRVHGKTQTTPKHPKQIIKLYGLMNGQKDGWCVKLYFLSLLTQFFWCSKEPSHREDSFEHQKCLSENIIVDLRIISKPTSKLNIKKWARVSPQAKCHLNGILWADRCGSDIVCWLGLLVMTCKTKR